MSSHNRRGPAQRRGVAGGHGWDSPWSLLSTNVSATSPATLGTGGGASVECPANLVECPAKLSDLSIHRRAPTSGRCSGPQTSAAGVPHLGAGRGHDHAK